MATGLVLQLQASDPILAHSATAHGLWASNATGDLMYAKGTDPIINITSALVGGVSASSSASTFTNNSGSSIPAFSPVSMRSDGSLIVSSVTTENNALAVVGITTGIIADTASASIITGGRVPNITTTALVADIIYISKTGTLTNVKPDIGVSGFVVGDFVVMIGLIVPNQTNPLNKDILVKLQLIGQL
jgi:hypothetical protein